MRKVPGDVEMMPARSSLFQMTQSPSQTMSTLLEFNEKKFWITLFPIVARREATGETRQHAISETPKQEPSERRIWANGPGSRESSRH
jgi:hypothetical protein